MINNIKKEAINEVVSFYKKYLSAMQLIEPFRVSKGYHYGDGFTKERLINIAMDIGIKDGLLLRSMKDFFSFEQLIFLLAVSITGEDIDGIAYPELSIKDMQYCLDKNISVSGEGKREMVVSAGEDWMHIVQNEKGLYRISFYDDFFRFKDIIFTSSGKNFTKSMEEVAQIFNLSPDTDRYGYCNLDYFNRERQYSMGIITDFRDATRKKFKDIGGLGADEIERIVSDYISGFLKSYDIDAKIRFMPVIVGSRARGLEHEDSDIDVVFEYEGSVSEDGLFNILNDELMIAGKKVDINPIRADKSGPLHEYLQNCENYLKEKEKNNALNESIVQFSENKDSIAYKR